MTAMAPAKPEEGWNWRGVIAWLGVPVLLGVSMQWVMVLREEARISLLVDSPLHFSRDYRLGDFNVQWRNGTIAIRPTRKSKREHSLW
jgi:hypothetical protein